MAANRPSPSAPRIFISYRREDGSGYAGRIHDALSQRFGSTSVFIDVDTIQPGADFREAIERAVRSCDALVVVIGPRWVGISFEKGGRRLEDPDDFVRLEIESALAAGVRVFPVTVAGARMPAAGELPGSVLPKLAYVQALELSDSRWRYDTGRLVSALEGLAGEAGPGPGAPALPSVPGGWRFPMAALWPRPALTALAAVLVLLTGALGWALSHRPPASAAVSSFRCAPAASAETAWAAVTAAGAASACAGVKAVGHVKDSGGKAVSGQYLVTFAREVDSCSYSVNIAFTPGRDPLHELVFVGRDKAVNTVFVHTTDVFGKDQDAPFWLSLSCPASGPWAVLNSDGSKFHGNALTSSGLIYDQATGQPLPGWYRIDVDRDIHLCSFNVTISNAPDSRPAQAMALVGYFQNFPRSVFVRTVDVSGRGLQNPTYVSFSCSNHGPWAVVDPTGTGLAAAGLRNVGHVKTGQYELVFDRDLRGCSLNATVGLPTDGSAPPYLAFVGRDSAQHNTVYVAATNPAGQPVDTTFYVGGVC